MQVYCSCFSLFSLTYTTQFSLERHMCQQTIILYFCLFESARQYLVKVILGLICNVFFIQLAKAEEGLVTSSVSLSVWKTGLEAFSFFFSGHYEMELFNIWSADNVWVVASWQFLHPPFIYFLFANSLEFFWLLFYCFVV